MKLYKVRSALASSRWHSSKTGLKDYEEVEMPRDGRAGMAAFLNGNELEVADTGDPALDPLEQAELRAVAAAGGTTLPHHYDYASPFSARSVLASIDAGLCATAIRQMHGSELAKIGTAYLERLAQLSAGVPIDGV